MKKSGGLRAGNALTGRHVRNRKGEQLGKIEDLMLDLRTGRVAYAVLSFGGVLGVGEKLFAVPPEALEPHDAEGCFVLDVEEEALRDAPGFDRDDWPDFADRQLMARIYGHYGHTP